jgi:hypothetical protein
MGSTRAGRAAAAAVLVTAAVVATSAAATPAEPHLPEQVLVTADLDGDGVPEPVTLRQLSPGTQLLRVALPEEILDATVGGDDTAPLPLSPPRPSDLDGDGRAELVLSVAVGANTTTYEAWRYDDDRGLHAVTDAGGAPWRLYEGGGVAAISGYGCAPGTPRRPYSVDVRWDESRPEQEPIRYVGEVVTYSLADGVARPLATEPLRGVVRDDPRVAVDPATCAP